jgi:hypothetical protein
VFFSEREVEASHGKDWRETAKDPTAEGGGRKALYSIPPSTAR